MKPAAQWNELFREVDQNFADKFAANFYVNFFILEILWGAFFVFFLFFFCVCLTLDDFKISKETPRSVETCWWEFYEKINEIIFKTFEFRINIDMSF